SPVMRSFFNGFNNVDDWRIDDCESAPPANIVETKDDFRIEIAAPGFMKKDFNIHIEKDLLSISKELEDQKEEENEKYSRKEFSYSSFKRTFKLSNLIDKENISAEYKNGILKVKLPKLEEAKDKPARDIKIA
ncbi:Hsp20/alpha crystallin family protein, partial [Bacteroidota bacterium]